MARCKAYEIQGPQANKKASAVRCVRDAAGKEVVDGRSFPVCKKHRGKAWTLFVADGWLYAIQLDVKKLTR
jgi:hypothetical protein